MSENALAGYLGRVYVCATEGGTYVEAGEVLNINIKSGTLQMKDCTSFADAGQQKQKPAGKSPWSATLEQFLVTSDAALDLMLDAQVNMTALWWKFHPNGTASGKPQRKGKGYVESFEEKQGVSDFVADTFNVVGEGDLDYTDQT